MLYIFAGLPGTGKTTLARLLAREVRAVHLRVDSIEQALRDAAGLGDGPEGYAVAYRVAADNLALGLAVVADSVNPLRVTRAAWRAVAAGAGVAAVEIEVVCSDAAEHRARVEARAADAAAGGARRLTWDDVRARAYDRWDVAPAGVVDTAGRTPAVSLAALRRAIGGLPRHPP